MASPHKSIFGGAAQSWLPDCLMGVERVQPLDNLVEGGL
jgi:hypothetical protein